MESRVETETEMQRALHCDAMRRTSNDPDDDDAPTTAPTSTSVDALVDRIEALKVKPGETKTEEEERASSSSSSSSSVIEGDASNGVPMVRRKRSVVVARRMIANALDIDLDGPRGSSKTEEEKRATREARKKKAEERARQRLVHEKNERERDEGRAGPVS